VSGQAIQKIPRRRKGHASICDKFPLLVCATYLHSARIDGFYQGIRATDLALGLRRIPAGFYVTVQAEDAKWQTTNKPVYIDADVVEWNERIVL